MIEHYEFGKIVVDGKRYTTDLMISPHFVKDGWWRKEGHRLWPEDLGEVIKQGPEILVVGTGALGLLEVLPETRGYLKEQQIELVVEKTEEACATYNRLCDSRLVVAALHLTC